MAQSARERRAAQRRVAATLKANRANPQAPVRLLDQRVRVAVWNARVTYANQVASGEQPMPAPMSREAKNLASLASYAAHGRADPRFEAAFSRYWYHFKDSHTPDSEADIEDNADYEDEEYEGE